jgi:hypothetical protein
VGTNKVIPFTLGNETLLLRDESDRSMISEQDSTYFEPGAEIVTDLVVGLKGGVPVSSLGKRLLHGHASIRAIS